MTGACASCPNHAAIVRTDLPESKVALLIGGGSGHEPVFHGSRRQEHGRRSGLRPGLAAPAPDIIYEAAKAVNRGKGVLFLYGNYAGDNMNFDIAAEMLEDDGIEVRTVRVTDDVAAAPPERTHDRRGIAGDIFMIKIAGGAASELDTLDEVERVARKAVANVRSIGVAVAAGSIPETGKLTFELADDEIEIGMGAHGEAGVARQKMEPADAIADELDAEDPRRPALQGGRRGGADDQQSRRHDDDGDAHRQPPHPPDPREGGHQGAPVRRRHLADRAGDGRLLGDAA